MAQNLKDWLIFSLVELHVPVRHLEEKSVWIHDYGGRILYDRVRNVRTEGNPSTHQREVHITIDGESKWYHDSKANMGRFEGGLIANDTLVTSNKVQDLISETVLKNFNSRNVEELRKSLQNVHFVRGIFLDWVKPHLCFDKKWLYEQIANDYSNGNDFLTIQGEIPGKFEVKNDAELKTFLQQLEELPAENGVGGTSSAHSRQSTSETPNLQSSDTPQSSISSPSQPTALILTNNNNSVESKIKNEEEFADNKKQLENQENIKNLTNSPKIIISTTMQEKGKIEENNNIGFENQPLLKKEKGMLQKEVEKMLADNPSIQNVELSKKVCEKVKDWKEELNQLTTFREIQAFKGKIEKFVAAQKVQTPALKKFQELNVKDSQKWSLEKIISVSLVIALTSISLILITKYFIKRKRKDY